MQSRRIVELDATRGAAMLAVCLSHSAVYLGASLQSTLGADLLAIGMIATPTFLMLSGVICGILLNSPGIQYARMQGRLIDRALFVAVVGHLLLGIVHATWSTARAGLVSSFYITDAVAVGLVLGTLTARRFSARTLLVAGLLLLAVAGITSELTRPGGDIERGLGRLLFGFYGAGSDEGYMVPLVPYLGVYLIGVAAGRDYVGRRQVNVAMVYQRWIGIGVFCVVAGLAAKLVWLIEKPRIAVEWQSLFYFLTEPRQKLPPGPTYLAFYGGAGAIMAGTIALIYRRGLLRRTIAAAAVIGRTSFLVFVAQYLFFYFPARALHVGVGSWFPLMPLSIAMLWLMALAWDRLEGNRLLTLGTGRLWMSVPPPATTEAGTTSP